MSVLTAFVRFALEMFSGHLLAKSMQESHVTFMPPEPSDCFSQHGREMLSETFLGVTFYGCCDESPETNWFIATER